MITTATVSMRMILSKKRVVRMIGRKMGVMRGEEMTKLGVSGAIVVGLESVVTIALSRRQ